VAFTWGATTPIETTAPSPPITPIQVRRCRWMIWRKRSSIRWHAPFGYLVIVGPGRRYWRPTRRAAIDLARRIRSRTITT